MKCSEPIRASSKYRGSGGYLSIPQAEYAQLPGNLLAGSMAHSIKNGVCWSIM
jgi:hypothetical protein